MLLYYWFNTYVLLLITAQSTFNKTEQCMVLFFLSYWQKQPNCQDVCCAVWRASVRNGKLQQSALGIICETCKFWACSVRASNWCIRAREMVMNWHVKWDTSWHEAGRMVITAKHRRSQNFCCGSALHFIVSSKSDDRFLVLILNIKLTPLN